MLPSKCEEELANILQIAENGLECWSLKEQEIREWLNSLLVEEPKRLFPKTPSAGRSIRKRHVEPTIVEEEEEEDVVVVALPVRSSRTAAKDACMKMKRSQQLMTLNNKLRRPSTSALVDISIVSVRSTISVTAHKSKRRRCEQPSSTTSSYTTADGESFANPLLGGFIKLEKLSSTSTREAACTELTENENLTELMSIAEHLAGTGKKRKTSVAALPQKAHGSPDLFSEDEDMMPLNIVASKLNPRKSSGKQELQVSISKLTPNTLNRYNASAPVSVKKRVALFEKMTDLSPTQQPSVEVEPSGRITRTKARALNATAQKASQQIMETSLLKKLARKSLNRAKTTMNKQNKINQERLAEKENAVLKPTPHILMSVKSVKATPLTNKPVRLVLTSANQNNSGAHPLPNFVTGIDTFISKPGIPKPPSVEETEEKKREELRKRQEKEDEVNRKRKELMELKAEEKRREREEKRLKVLQVREALDQKKLEAHLKSEREKEEKARQLLERGEQEQRELVSKKKAAGLKKAAEAEERRRIEEATRLQKIKEQEEEQRKVAEKRKKDAEEAETQLAKRKLEEQQAEALAKKKQLKKKLALNNTFVIDESQASVHPAPQPLRAAGPDDYEIFNKTVGESDDEDQNPKPCVPLWSRKENLRKAACKQCFLPLGIYKAIFESRPTTPDLSVMFSNPKLKLHKRTSSACWTSMPPRFSYMPKMTK